METIYNKYRIYATEIYRNIRYGKLPRTISEVKKEYNVPEATTVQNKLCFYYNDKLQMLDEEQIRGIIFEALKQKLKKMKFESILEIGCGSGRNLAYVQRCYPDKKIYGVDIAEQMIKEAKQNVPSATFFCCSASEIPLDDKSIDVVFSVHAIEQMTAVLPSVVKELKRVCKDRIVLMELFPEIQNFIGVMHNKRLGYPMDLLKRISESGFHVVSFEDGGFGNPINRTGVLVGEVLK